MSQARGNAQPENIEAYLWVSGLVNENRCPDKGVGSQHRLCLETVQVPASSQTTNSISWCLLTFSQVLKCTWLTIKDNHDKKDEFLTEGKMATGMFMTIVYVI